MWVVLIVVGIMNLILSTDTFVYVLSGHFLFFDATLQAIPSSAGFWVTRMLWLVCGVFVWVGTFAYLLDNENKG